MTYYAANREARLAYQKARYATKAEDLRAYQREYQRRNREKERQRSRAYTLRRMPHILAKERERHQRMRDADPDVYYAKARAKARAFREANPTWYRDKDARRRAQQLKTTVEPIDYAEVTRRSRGICGICREPLGGAPTHFDHIVPLARGGAHTTSNLQIAHAVCNLRKGARVA